MRLHGDMTSESPALHEPTVSELPDLLQALASWHHDGLPGQLHPGDLGWQWRLGAEKVARSLRVWSIDGTPAAIAFVDADVSEGEAAVARMAMAPDFAGDERLARTLVHDLPAPERIRLPNGISIVEARFGDAFRAELTAQGWTTDDPWTPLRRALSREVETCGLRIETVEPGKPDDRVEVQTAAFKNSTFTAERWHTMAQGPAYADARCLVGYDENGAAVAAITVWSAGPGRPGVIEPMGVHHDHRGRGHGRAITVAGAAALREMGASSALVATPASNEAGVATYVSAGFEAGTPVPDFVRPRN